MIFYIVLNFSIVSSHLMTSRGVAPDVTESDDDARPMKRPETRTIFVMRHGFRNDRSSSNNFLLTLEAEAVDAVEALRKVMSAEGKDFGTILCSPWLRCRQTAAALGPARPCLVEPGVSEALDPYDGLEGTTLDWVLPQIRRLAQASPLVDCGELREEPEDFGMQRALMFTQRLLARPEMFQDGPVLIVTHGSTAFGIIESLVRGSLVEFDLGGMPGQCSVTELQELGGH